MALIALLIYFVATSTVVAVRVVGSSMNPTLDDGDLLIATRLDYRLRAPERGDIVLVKDPYDPSQNLIKRIIGVPGDRLLIRVGHVYVNGSRLNEPYLSRDWRTTLNWPSEPDQPEGVPVPPGQFFVLGDNRDHSSDSRLFGYIGLSQIEARALVRLWPLGAVEVLAVKPTLAGAG